MAEILSLAKAREERSPHLSGRAVCIGCKHVWQAVAPVGTVELECPACGLEKGRYAGLVETATRRWTCNCGNDLFHITTDDIYCVGCGAVQKF
jgi:hypothetical protein